MSADGSFFEVIHTFKYTTSNGGMYPVGLMRGRDKNLYGTSEGGQFGVGTIFRITETGEFSTLYSFSETSIHTPYSALVAGGDGTLYGIAHAGGSGCGGSYIFVPSTRAFTEHQRFDFDMTGCDSYGPLGVGGVDRHLYGTQMSGGPNGQGVLFGLGDITVADRLPFPVALASPNYAEADSPQGKTVELNALGSWDPDFDDLMYSWGASLRERRRPPPLSAPPSQWEPRPLR